MNANEQTHAGDAGRGVAIVTGAARRIGAAIATELHRRGLSVLIHCRQSRTEAQELIERLEGQRPGSARIFQADLAEESAPGRIVEAALDAFGRLDVLVNNASIFYPQQLDEATPSSWETLMTVNLRAPFFLSRAAAPSLARQGGAIVNLADIYGVVPLLDHAVYSQSKAALIAQTRALARELAPEVRVNAVAPGAILWPEEGASGERNEEILRRVALGRLGRPEDIAGAVAFLALDAPYVTGQLLAVDGGRLLNM